MPFYEQGYKKRHRITVIHVIEPKIAVITFIPSSGPCLHTGEAEMKKGGVLGELQNKTEREIKSVTNGMRNPD